MSFLKDLLTKQRYPVILLLAGFMLVLLAEYSVAGELTKLQVQARATFQWPTLALGIVCIALSVGLFLFDPEDLIGWLSCKLETTDTGFKTKFRDTMFHVDFGLLQDLYSPAMDNAVVVLPANEYFDDRCFNDARTAAGAFMRGRFSPEQARVLRKLVDSELQHLTFQEVARESHGVSRSFGTGTCVYLEQPLATPYRIILASVATDRDDEGLRTELESIFKVMAEVRRIVAEHRLSAVYIPLIGAGKGGVPAQVAFLALAIAVLENRCREGGHLMKDIHAVIYRPDGKDPQLSTAKAKAVVRQVVTLYKEVSR
jgi:hypothetical protein